MGTTEHHETPTHSTHGPRSGMATEPTTAPAPTTQTPTAGPGTTFETLAVCGFIFGLFAIVAAVFAVGLAARAVDEAKDSTGGTEVTQSAGGVSTLEVSLKDFLIEPEDLRVNTGAVLQISNDGAVVHNLAVDGTASDMFDPGGSGTLDLGDLQPGSYAMICEVPGHEAAGMRGTLVIE